MKIITCVAPVNIAVIKYWGKRNEDLILPINDSISSTLSTDYMCAKTTIIASPTFKENKFWLNGEDVSFENQRLRNCLNEVKRRANPNCSELLQWKIHICSENNFPTAAGLASSAAGYACLVFTLANLYGVEGDISGIARIGSGSACRSVYGGWVHWNKGLQSDGHDSVAVQIASKLHWPEMHILILVVNENKKKTSSTTGMKRSVETSKLLQYRADNIVPQRVKEMTEAIRDKNFDKFAKITMKDSNQFHSVCLDTYPPIFYLNEVSSTIIELVHSYNAHRGSNKVAYTFDAGPNACLYLLQPDVEEVVSLINEVFPPSTTNSEEYIKGHPVIIQNSKILMEKLNLKQHPECLKYIIHTEVGDGPKILTNSSEHLMTENGIPKGF